MSNIEIIETPSTNDVLCGKDKTYQLHPGNRLYRQLIEQTAVVYSTKATKQDKMQMTQNIVKTMMREHGARFLRRVEDNQDNEDVDSWEEITHQQARDKTSHALRFCAASLHRKQQSSQTTTTTTATPTKKRRRNRHRRTVSRDSNASNGGNNKRSSTNSHHAARVSWTHQDDPQQQNQQHDSLFARQQAILQQTLYSNSSSNRSFNYNAQDDDNNMEPIPVETASSEDLDHILSQPLNVHDWDGLFQEL